jgi:hypothetical protein
MNRKHGRRTQSNSGAIALWYSFRDHQFDCGPNVGAPERGFAMTQHFTRNTISAAAWCPMLRSVFATIWRLA